jgi:ATP-dependent Clp protease adapter protein ClpS
MITEKLRPKVANPEPVQKPKKRPNYTVVMTQPVGLYVPCASCLLREVFRHSAERANNHVENARQKGAEPVFESSKDVAEQKAKDANAVALVKASTCFAHMLSVIFTCEPAP